ncbi:MAG TPA: response regulator [Anaerolineales bacterium]|nr:response regulator [Anaerolineales bacterium]HNB41021.1 response regulator [Anaerolineales bacterium]HND49988.1 response regulator [Anaerolineales bacterium]HNE05593.1 response regulator [Anaerolineales bacterium]HNF94690.1 response regulator [Anaerolineales bacterium]
MSKAKILVVDDEPNNQRILTYTLNKAGYESAAIADGENTLVWLASNTPDLAILDVSMPGMDGITLLTHIRSMPQYSRLPVIILTGSGDDDERLRAEGLGIQAFLTKPASSKTVLEAVANLLPHE